MNLHPAIGKLEWLVGKWTSTNGLCQYPTFSKTLYFKEELEIWPIEGQPCLSFRSSSQDVKSGRVLHQTTGFIQYDPNEHGNSALILAHMNGMTEISEGIVDPLDKIVEFVSHRICGTSFGPNTKLLRREIRSRNQNELEQVLYMQTVCTPESEHCRTLYSKQ